MNTPDPRVAVTPLPPPHVVRGLMGPRADIRPLAHVLGDRASSIVHTDPFSALENYQTPLPNDEERRDEVSRMDVEVLRNTRRVTEGGAVTTLIGPSGLTPMASNGSLVLTLLNGGQSQGVQPSLGKRAAVNCHHDHLPGYVDAAMAQTMEETLMHSDQPAEPQSAVPESVMPRSAGPRSADPRSAEQQPVDEQTRMLEAVAERLRAEQEKAEQPKQVEAPVTPAQPVDENEVEGAEEDPSYFTAETWTESINIGRREDSWAAEEMLERRRRNWTLMTRIAAENEAAAASRRRQFAVQQVMREEEIDVRDDVVIDYDPYGENSSVATEEFDEKEYHETFDDLINTEFAQDDPRLEFLMHLNRQPFWSLRDVTLCQKILDLEELKEREAEVEVERIFKGTHRDFRDARLWKPRVNHSILKDRDISVIDSVMVDINCLNYFGLVRTPPPSPPPRRTGAERVAAMLNPTRADDPTRVIAAEMGQQDRTLSGTGMSTGNPATDAVIEQVLAGNDIRMRQPDITPVMVEMSMLREIRTAWRQRRAYYGGLESLPDYLRYDYAQRQWTLDKMRSIGRRNMNSFGERSDDIKWLTEEQGWPRRLIDDDEEFIKYLKRDFSEREKFMMFRTLDFEWRLTPKPPLQDPVEGTRFRHVCDANCLGAHCMFRETPSWLEEIYTYKSLYRAEQVFAEWQHQVERLDGTNWPTGPRLQSPQEIRRTLRELHVRDNRVGWPDLLKLEQKINADLIKQDVEDEKYDTQSPGSTTTAASAGAGGQIQSAAATTDPAAAGQAATTPPNPNPVEDPMTEEWICAMDMNRFYLVPDQVVADAAVMEAAILAGATIRRANPAAAAVAAAAAAAETEAQAAARTAAAEAAAAEMQRSVLRRLSTATAGRALGALSRVTGPLTRMMTAAAGSGGNNAAPTAAAIAAAPHPLAAGPLMVPYANGMMVPAPNCMMVPATNGMMVPGPNGMMVPGAIGMMVPAANGMMVPAANGMMVPAANGMMVPAANGMMVPAANGMMVPAANGMMMPALTDLAHGGVLGNRAFFRRPSGDVFPAPLATDLAAAYQEGLQARRVTTMMEQAGAAARPAVTTAGPAGIAAAVPAQPPPVNPRPRHLPARTLRNTPQRRRDPNYYINGGVNAAERVWYPRRHARAPTVNTRAPAAGAPPRHNVNPALPIMPPYQYPVSEVRNPCGGGIGNHAPAPPYPSISSDWMRKFLAPVGYTHAGDKPYGLTGLSAPASTFFMLGNQFDEPDEEYDIKEALEFCVEASQQSMTTAHIILSMGGKNLVRDAMAFLRKERSYQHSSRLRNYIVKSADGKEEMIIRPDGFREKHIWEIRRRLSYKTCDELQKLAKRKVGGVGADDDYADASYLSPHLSGRVVLRNTRAMGIVPGGGISEADREVERRYGPYTQKCRTCHCLGCYGPDDSQLAYLRRPHSERTRIYKEKRNWVPRGTVQDLDLNVAVRIAPDPDNRGADPRGPLFGVAERRLHDDEDPFRVAFRLSRRELDRIAMEAIEAEAEQQRQAAEAAEANRRDFGVPLDTARTHVELHEAAVRERLLRGRRDPMPPDASNAADADVHAVEPAANTAEDAQQHDDDNASALAESDRALTSDSDVDSAPDAGDDDDESRRERRRGPVEGAPKKRRHRRKKARVFTEAEAARLSRAIVHAAAAEQILQPNVKDEEDSNISAVSSGGIASGHPIGVARIDPSRQALDAAQRVVQAFVHRNQTDPLNIAEKPTQRELVERHRQLVERRRLMRIQIYKAKLPRGLHRDHLRYLGLRVSPDARPDCAARVHDILDLCSSANGERSETIQRLMNSGAADDDLNSEPDSYRQVLLSHLLQASPPAPHESGWLRPWIVRPEEIAEQLSHLFIPHPAMRALAMCLEVKIRKAVRKAHLQAEAAAETTQAAPTDPDLQRVRKHLGPTIKHVLRYPDGSVVLDAQPYRMRAEQDGPQINQSGILRVAMTHKQYVKQNKADSLPGLNARMFTPAIPDLEGWYNEWCHNASEATEALAARVEEYTNRHRQQQIV